jgi:hypothetical protein
MQRARNEGALVFGYLHWSICDNWEWIDGYRKEARFGLFSVAGLDGVSPRRRHSITDGALALCHAVRTPPGSIASAVRGFGRYAPDGAIIEHPVASPYATFHSQLDGGHLTLLFSATETTPEEGEEPRGGIFGLLYHDDAERWIGLDRIEWNPVTRSIRFSHRRFSDRPETPARLFTGIVDPSGDRIISTLSERSDDGSSGRTVEFTRARLAGMWQGRSSAGMVITLSLSCPEGIWRGRVLRSADWAPLESIEVDAAGFSAIESGLATAGILEADSALVVPEWNVRLRRLPEMAPF